MGNQIVTNNGLDIKTKLQITGTTNYTEFYLGTHIKKWALEQYSNIRADDKDKENTLYKDNNIKKRACCTNKTGVGIAISGVSDIENDNNIIAYKVVINPFDSDIITDKQCIISVDGDEFNFHNTTTSSNRICAQFYQGTDTGNGFGGFCKHVRKNRSDVNIYKDPTTTQLYGLLPDSIAENVLNSNALNAYVDCNCVNSIFNMKQNEPSLMKKKNTGVSSNTMAQSIDMRCNSFIGDRNSPGIAWVPTLSVATNICVNNAEMRDIGIEGNNNIVNQTQTCNMGGSTETVYNDGTGGDGGNGGNGGTGNGGTGNGGTGNGGTGNGGNGDGGYGGDGDGGGNGGYGGYDGDGGSTVSIPDTYKESDNTLISGVSNIWIIFAIVFVVVLICYCACFLCFCAFL